MATENMPHQHRLEGFISYPREDIDVEYKDWLDLKEEKAKATLAKAAIALANHGGGHIILGFAEGRQKLVSRPLPDGIPSITQDSVNAIVRRYAEPEFHCEVFNVTHPATSALHVAIKIPGSEVPVVCKRDQREAKVFQHKVYVRKPGPRSEEPHTANEWRELLDRCVLARRQEMLDAIRTIVLGQAVVEDPGPRPQAALQDYCTEAHRRWNEIVAGQPNDSPCRFPKGFYELGFGLVGAAPAKSLADLKSRLSVAQRVNLSGWPPFPDIGVEGWGAYAHKNVIEAWLGKPREDQLFSDSLYCDYWRASPDGKLYTIRGYLEDSEEAQKPNYDLGGSLVIDEPIKRIAEGILFADRIAREFEGVERLSILCRFSGLDERSLVFSYDRIMRLSTRYISHTNETTLTSQVTLQQVQDNLVEVIHGILQPLYEQFGFYRLTLDEVRSVLRKFKPIADISVTEV